MSKSIHLFSIELTRQTASLPPGVADAMPAFEFTRQTASLPPGVADAMPEEAARFEETQRDYTLEVRAVRAVRARMIIRHSVYQQQHRAMQRAQHR